MRKLIAAVALACLATLAIAAPALAWTWGNPQNYIYEDNLTPDNNGDGVIVFRNLAPNGSPERAAFNTGVESWNEVNADFGGRGVEWVRASQTPLEPEATLRVTTCESVAGFADRADDEAFLCSNIMEGRSELIYQRNATHEIGHLMRFQHRPNSQSHVSIMSMAGDRGAFTIRLAEPGDADYESFKSEWVLGEN